MFGKIRLFILAHKIWSTIVVLVVIVGIYSYVERSQSANSMPQYVLAAARTGMLQQTVTGTGQISASNQTDIQSQISGAITGIDVKVGQNVTQSQLIATIDSTNAALSLKNAKLSLAKLTEPAKATDFSNATNNVNKAYNDAFDAASAAYLDLPDIMAGMKALFYGSGGFLSDQNSATLTATAHSNRDQAGMAYDAAVVSYAASLAEFKNLTRSSSKTDLDKLLDDTYATMKSVTNALNLTQTTVTYITTYQPGYYSSLAISAASNVTSWASKANSDLTSIVSAQNTVGSSQNAMTALTTGADILDIQTAELTVEEAQRTYDEYFIRAPYDGVIGRIPVSVYGQAAAGTVMATIIGQQKIATVSLNEVDAARVNVGQTVMITFDAIDGLNATGTVEQVDQVGTVTQGVVSYSVKILVNTNDPRIKPGMSVNVTIITNQEDNVLLVPSSAIKTQGNVKYVQVFDPQTVITYIRSQNTGAAGASTSRQSRFGSSTNSYNFGSTTASTTGGFNRTNFGSTTRSFTDGTRSFSGTPTITYPSTTAPQQVIVTTGDSDDTNTVIVSGLNRGQFVVTRTITANSSGTTAPSIFSSLGARGSAAGGANRGGNVRIGG